MAASERYLWADFIGSEWRMLMYIYLLACVCRHGVVFLAIVFRFFPVFNEV